MGRRSNLKTTQMKPENRQIFEENKIHWETLTKAGYLKHLSGPARSNLMRAMSEEFQPGYTADLWCPTCVSNMIIQVYRRYNEFVEQEQAVARATILANEPAEEPPIIPPVDFHPLEPVQTKANFPSHKHRRR